MDKTKIYKGLKFVFFMAGFPLLILLLISTMAPMFGQEVMGSHAVNWILIFLAIWAFIVILQFVLEKFVGKKSENHHKLVLVITAAASIIMVLVPTAIFDATAKANYDADYQKLENKGLVRNYESAMGWHRDFTSKKSSAVYELINANNDFMKLYNLSGVESSWYGNADKENNIGYRMGSREKADVLIKEKTLAKAKLPELKAELEKIEGEIAAAETALADAETALAADPQNAELIAARDTVKAAYDQIVLNYEDDLVRLKGARVDISAYKNDLVNIVVSIIKNTDTVLPDGLTISLAGMNIEVGKLVNTIMGLVGGSITPESISALIPDVIYTGLATEENKAKGIETITTYENMVNGTDSDKSLAEVQAFAFKLEHYPSVLAAGATRYACYVTVGLIVLSIFMTDYFDKKIKEAK